MRVDKFCKSLGVYLIVDGFWRCSVIGHNECWYMQPWNVKSDTCSWNKVSVFSLLINFFQLCIKLEPCFVKSMFLVKGRIISIMNQALYIKYNRNQVLLLTVRGQWSFKVNLVTKISVFWRFLLNYWTDLAQILTEY